METVQSEAFALNPIWDQMMAERGGREPHQFEGHEEWDSSQEAKEAFERGVLQAVGTAALFFGGEPGARMRDLFTEPDVSGGGVPFPEEPNGWDSDAVERKLAEFRTAKRIANRKRRRKS
jgi:hypothetical protein